MTEAKKNIPFHAHWRKEALQTFRNINATTKRIREDVLKVFRQEFVKREFTGTAKHKWHKFTFDPNKKSLSVFSGVERRRGGSNWC